MTDVLRDLLIFGVSCLGLIVLLVLFLALVLASWNFSVEPDEEDEG